MHKRTMRNLRSRRRVNGFTIVELLVGVAIGLFLIAVSSIVYIGNRQTTTTQRDQSQLSQTGAFALNTLTRMLQQSGHVAVGGLGADNVPAPNFCGQATNAIVPPASGTNAGGAIEGLDAASLGTVIGASDMITVRYYGSSALTGVSTYRPDGSIRDCFGNSIGGPSGGTGGTDRAWSRLYVDTDTSTGNPALYCSSLSSAPVGSSMTAQTSASTQALVDNVESFQVLYGVGAWFDPVSGNKLDASKANVTKAIAVTKYLPASAMVVPTDWNNVIAVRVGLVIAGDANSRATPDSTVYSVFGSGYPSSINGAQFDASASTSLASARRSRIRQVFSTTIELKNAPLLLGCPVS